MKCFLNQNQVGIPKRGTFRNRQLERSDRDRHLDREAIPALELIWSNWRHTCKQLITRGSIYAQLFFIISHTHEKDRHTEQLGLHRDVRVQENGYQPIQGQLHTPLAQGTRGLDQSGHPHRREWRHEYAVPNTHT